MLRFAGLQIRVPHVSSLAPFACGVDHSRRRDGSIDDCIMLHGSQTARADVVRSTRKSRRSP